MPPKFTEEVMRAIDRAPRPSPTRALGWAILERSGEEARGALSVAWRIARHATSMPLMVRAQALALVVLVAGSVLGGSVLGAVVAYRTVEPIVHSILAPPDDHARSLPDVIWAPRPPTPQETASPAGPSRSVTSEGSELLRDGRNGPGLDRDEDPEDAVDGDEVDGVDGDEVDGVDGDEVDGGDGDEDDGGDGDEDDGGDGDEDDGGDGDEDDGGDGDEGES